MSSDAQVSLGCLRSDSLAHQGRQALQNKAMKAELSQDYDLAFKLYIQAAEQYLHRSRLPTQSDKLKELLKANARKCMERAEKIKSAVSRKSPSVAEPSSSKATPPPTLTPVAIDPFSEGSDALLKHVNFAERA